MPTSNIRALPAGTLPPRMAVSAGPELPSRPRLDASSPDSQHDDAALSGPARQSHIGFPGLPTLARVDPLGLPHTRDRAFDRGQPKLEQYGAPRSSASWLPKLLSPRSKLGRQSRAILAGSALPPGRSVSSRPRNMRRRRRRRGVGRHRPAGRVPIASPHPRRRGIGRPSGLSRKSELPRVVAPPPLSAQRLPVRHARRLRHGPAASTRLRRKRLVCVSTFWIVRGQQQFFEWTTLSDEAPKGQPRNMRIRFLRQRSASAHLERETGRDRDAAGMGVLRFGSERLG